MKNNINKKVGATLLAAAIMAGTAVIPMSNAALETAVAKAARATAKPSIQYRTQVQDYGWEQHWSGKEWRTDGETAGTVGQSKRMEAVNIRLINCEGVSIDVVAHVQDYGDIEYKNINENTMIGTQKEEKRIEAIKVTTHGLKEQGYKILYRTQVQDYGWEQHWSGKEWREEGEWSGTRGESKRLETIEMMVVPIDEDEPVVSTKMDYIKSTEMALTFNSDPSNYYYTLKDSDDASVDVSNPVVDTKTNQVVLTTAALSNGTTYTLTVKDKNDREIEKRTFTYRNLAGVETVSIEDAGINAKNVNALNVTPSLSGANAVDTYVELTLVNSVEPDNKVVLKGTIGKTLVDTVITKNVSDLKDGTITISAKVYDKEGNITETSTETSSITTTPSTLLKGVEPTKLSVTSSTRDSYLDGTVVLNEISTTTGIKLSNVYYIIAEKGAKVPTVEEIVKDENELTGSFSSGSETVTITKSNLEQGKVYNVYIVTKNNVGTLSNVITATIAKDGILNALRNVTDIKSNENGTFSWADNQTATRGYIVQLTQDKYNSNSSSFTGTATVIAETTVTGKNVDFSNIIKEQKEHARYSVNVIAVGDYATVKNSSTATGSVTTAGQYLEVSPLTAPTTSIANINASTVRITLGSNDQRANAFKIVVTKGAEKKIAANDVRVVFDEKNVVYTTTQSVNVNWIDLNVSNYADGAYQIAVSAIKGSSATDVALLDSNETSKYYARVATKITNYKDEITNSTYKVEFVPVTVEGVANDGYVVKQEKLDTDTGVWSNPANASLTGGAVTNKNNTSIMTYTVDSLDPNASYKMHLIPQYASTFDDKDDTSVAFNASYIANNVNDPLDIVKEVKTKANPMASGTYTVKTTDLVAGDANKTIAIVDNVLKVKDSGVISNATGSNLAEVKGLVEKLKAGDQFTLETDGSISAVVIDATSITNTRIVALGNTAKDADLTVNGKAGQQVTVSGNIGKGTITLATAGTFDVTGLSNNDKTVVADDDALKIYASAGTSIDVTDTNAIINNITITGTGTVTATAGNAITVKDNSAITKVAAADNKTITFAGTHSDLDVEATGTDNTITIKTADVNSSIASLDVIDGKVDIVNAYITRTAGIQGLTLTKGTVITDEAYKTGTLVITPVSGNVTITKTVSAAPSSKATYAVSGKAKVEYTDSAKNVTALGGAKEDVELTSVANMTDYTFATNNVATYTLKDNTDASPKAVIEITLTAGTLNISEN